MSTASPTAAQPVGPLINGDNKLTPVILNGKVQWVDLNRKKAQSVERSNETLQQTGNGALASPATTFFHSVLARLPRDARERVIRYKWPLLVGLMAVTIVAIGRLVSANLALILTIGGLFYAMFTNLGRRREGKSAHFNCTLERLKHDADLQEL